MTNKLYQRLTEANVIDNQIKEITLQIEKLRSMLLPGAIRYDKDKIQTSPSDDLMSDTLGKIEELEKDKCNLVSNYIKAMDSVCNLINCLEDEQSRLLLKHRYIGNVPWKEVAERMQYSEEWCYKKRREAISILEKSVQ